MFPFLGSIIVNKNPTIVTFCYICYKRLAQSLANDEVLLGLIIGFFIRSTGNKTSRQFILFVCFVHPFTQITAGLSLGHTRPN